MFSKSHQNVPFLSAKSTKSYLCKSLAISGLLLYIIYIFSDHSLAFTSLKNSTTRAHTYGNNTLNINHVVFGIASSSTTWRNRRDYIESWWQPNITRGFIFLDRVRRGFFPWPPSSPPLRVSGDISRYKEYTNPNIQLSIRIVHMIAEIFRAENKGVRWYVMMDDDTIIFIDNLLDVLEKYDHSNYFYVGANSECVSSNFFHSFEMGFGGGGYALSYPLVEALAKNLDVCIKRYAPIYGSDHILQACVADLGVSLTQEKGFHQIDLHRDISGFLSALPQSPLLSLHHLDAIDPIFPSKDRHKSVRHLMKAAKADSSRLLQQTICYHKLENWTFSIAWGYSAQIYEGIHPPSILQRPLETFIPWMRAAKPHYMFSTRLPSKNPCEVPHVFLFDAVEETNGSNIIVTSYNRKSPRRLPSCPSSGNHSANHIYKILVLSSMERYNEAGVRRECCDIFQEAGMNITKVKLRTCMKHEIVA